MTGVWKGKARDNAAGEELPELQAEVVKAVLDGGADAAVTRDFLVAETIRKRTQAGQARRVRIGPSATAAPSARSF